MTEVDTLLHCRWIVPVVPRGAVLDVGCSSGAFLFAAGYLCSNVVSTHAASNQRVFELRTYTAAPGKLEKRK